MKKFVVYGLALGFLLFTLEVINYRALVRQISLEIYGALVAVVSLSFGIWLGYNLVVQGGETKKPYKPLHTNLSDREYEVLHLMAGGKSNQEIADQLFVSLNTVKTHTSNIFAKLDVKRRTQAIQRARELELIA